MKCPYCENFKGYKVRGYPVKDQLWQHIMVNHFEKLSQPDTVKEVNAKG